VSDVSFIENPASGGEPFVATAQSASALIAAGHALITAASGAGYFKRGLK
jgi:hypothetical protein